MIQDQEEKIQRTNYLIEDPDRLDHQTLERRDLHEGQKRGQDLVLEKDIKTKMPNLQNINQDQAIVPNIGHDRERNLNLSSAQNLKKDLEVDLVPEIVHRVKDLSLEVNLNNAQDLDSVAALEIRIGHIQGRNQVR